MLGTEYWNRNSQLLIYNIDTYVKSGQMKSTELKGDGFIPCFNGYGDHWSFVKTDSAGLTIKVREKERISENFTLGAYYIKTCQLYEDLYNEYYRDSSNMEKGEKGKNIYLI